MQRYDTRALELDKILELLAQEASGEAAKQLAKELSPQGNLAEAKRALSETDDAFVLSAKFGAPSFSALFDMTNAVRRAQAGGGLSLSELLKVCSVLKNFRGISEWRSRSAGMSTGIDYLFSGVMPNRFLEEKLDSAIISEEEISDHASSELSDIRRKIRAAENRAREQLDKLVRSSYYQKYLQDAIVTQRGGRYVVPVKAEYRTEIPGLVHDTSSSGATLFIEPMGVVDANNEVRVLRSAEKEEIERIIAALSAEVGAFADTFLRSFSAAVRLDLVFAKASLAYKMNAVQPKMNEIGKIELHRARHPLIQKKVVVPTDIELGKSFDTLVITGPNTGGKTVALKTVGLLSLMAMCGLMIPASDGSEISVFSSILADIGDEQSIEQSLSTFSSHMTNIIKIQACADQNSLVLLDELGAGTDPVEGAALAEAILEDLRIRGAKIISTTHYAELKSYALHTKGVENACCEFDVASLRPTYRLLIGVPGRSNAFAITEKLGMEKRIVERAGELVSEESTRFEEVLLKLEERRTVLEEEQKLAESARRAAQEKEKTAAAALEKAEQEAKKELDKARQEASLLVSRTRARVENLVEEAQRAEQREKKFLSAEEKANFRRGLRELEGEADPVSEKKSDENYVLPRPLAVGDEVLIASIEKQGSVLSLSPDGKSAEIQAGILKTRVPVSDLRLITGKKKEEKRSRSVTKQVSSRPVTEVDLRGQTADEAIMNVDFAIDSAILSGIAQITFIHGKGTGVLRKAVMQHLKRHPAIKTCRLGTFGEGESGVTIAELK